MPVGLKLCEEERIVYSLFWAEVTESDLKQDINNVSTLIREGTIDASWAQVVDFSEVESASSVTSTCVQSLAQQTPWPKETIRVLVITNTLIYGFSRMYQIFADLEESGTFEFAKSVAEAEAYIKAKRAE